MTAPEPAQAASGLALSLRGVRRVFRSGDEEVEALAGVDLEVAPGSFLALLGPSGCGKSTLLRIVAGLDRQDAGEVRIGGSPLEQVGGRPPDLRPGPRDRRAGPLDRRAGARDRTRLAYVFQDAHLLPWRDVLDNVALPLELLGRRRAAARGEARAAIEEVGLGEALHRHPAQLSGGMRMRVSLARALVTRPRLLLLDEPFAALDEITRHALDDQLRALWAESGATILFVTHSIAEAAFLAERAVVLSPRPARIVLDAVLDLPVVRSAALRGDPRYAHAMGELSAALHEGGAR